MERLEDFCINKFALPVKHLKGEGSEEMDFSHQEIQYEDVIIISFLLNGSRGSLHTINLANNAVCEKEPGLEDKPRSGRSPESLWGLDSLFTAVRSSSVQVLDLSNNAIGIDGCEIVSNHVSQGLPVTVLKLGNNQLCGKRRDLLDHWQGDYEVAGFEAVANSFKANKGIVHLDLSENYIGPEGASFLEGVVAMGNARLTHLDVSWNNIGPSGCASLTTVVQKLPGLVILNIADNNLGGWNGFSSEDTMHQDLSGWKELCKTFKHHRKLTSLDISRNGLFFGGMQMFTDAMAWIDKIVREEYGEEIEEEILVFMPLTNLDLRSNSMGVHGGELVLEMAHKVTTLQTLCGIPKSLMEAGETVSLDLAGNDRRKLEDGGTLVFAFYLRAYRFKLKHRLHEVDLSNNSLGFEGGKALNSALVSSGFTMLKEIR
jgi:Ran GTPase-activating protein (RanGAP) involved in mRNA processing and transport